MRCGIIVFLVLFCQSLPVFSANATIGKVKTYKPEATIYRHDNKQAVIKGMGIQVGDRILTGSTGTVGIVLEDGAVLCLGPRSEFIIDKFVFRPEEKDVSFVSRIMRGTMSFLSGAIGRIAPQAVKFATPTATLGLRGTKILVEVR